MLHDDINAKTLLHLARAFKLVSPPSPVQHPSSSQPTSQTQSTSPSYNPHTSPSNLHHHLITAPIMDFIKNAMGNNDNDQREPNQQNRTNEPTAQKASGGGGGGGGFLGGFGDKLNSAAGGGRESEKNEDYLDKGNSAPFPQTGAHTQELFHTCHTHTLITHTH